MVTSLHKTLRSQGQTLNLDAARFGELRESTTLANDPVALRERMAQDGYIFLRSYLDTDDVLRARHDLLHRVADQDGLAPGSALMEGVLAGPGPVRFAQPETQRMPALQRLLFQGPMIAFFERFLGGPVRGLDFIWVRSVVPGFGTKPHGDSVFMNRGTKDLYTAWTPLGTIDRHLGGLIVLEGSHRLHHVQESYSNRDVDTYCENDALRAPYPPVNGKPWTGHISDDPVALRNELGGRWLSADFQPGDLLVFSMQLLHASLDNGSADRLRLSTDTRYQLASEPVDPRWVGQDPIGHGPEAKQGIIC